MADSNSETSATASTDGAATVRYETSSGRTGIFFAALARAGRQDLGQAAALATRLDDAIERFEPTEADVVFSIDESGSPSFELRSPFFTLFFVSAPTERESTWGLATHADSSKEGILASGRIGVTSLEAVLGLILERRRSFRLHASADSQGQSALTIRSA